MSRRLLLCAAIVALPLAVVSCGKKGEESSSTSPAGSASAAVADEDVPVPADYAEEAQKIGNDDYKSKLDELESEIDKDEK